MSLSLSESFHPFILNIISKIFGLKFSLIMYILFVESILCLLLFPFYLFLLIIFMIIFSHYLKWHYFCYLIITLEVVTCILNLSRSNGNWYFSSLLRKHKDLRRRFLCVSPTCPKPWPSCIFIFLCIENKPHKTLLLLVSEYFLRLNILLITLFVLHFFQYLCLSIMWVFSFFLEDDICCYL